MYKGQRLSRWKWWLLVGSFPLLQLGQCTVEQQNFWRGVQNASDTLLTGVVAGLFQVIQNRDGDDVVGVDTAAWAVKHVLAGWW